LYFFVIAILLNKTKLHIISVGKNKIRSVYKPLIYHIIIFIILSIVLALSCAFYAGNFGGMWQLMLATYEPWVAYAVLLSLILFVSKELICLPLIFLLVNIIDAIVTANFSIDSAWWPIALSLEILFSSIIVFLYWLITYLTSCYASMVYTSIYGLSIAITFTIGTLNYFLKWNKFDDSFYIAIPIFLFVHLIFCLRAKFNKQT